MNYKIMPTAQVDDAAELGAGTTVWEPAHRPGSPDGEPYLVETVTGE